MAKNKKYERGEYMSLPVVSGTVSGNPVIVGGKLPGVAMTDRGKGGNSSTNASVDCVGVYTLSVKGIDGVGNSAVAVGDTIFHVDADTPKLSKKATGVAFGIALGTLTSGATGNIDVLLFGPQV